MKKPVRNADQLDLVAATSGRSSAPGTGFSAAKLSAGLEVAIGGCRVEQRDIAESGLMQPSILFVCQDAAGKPGALIFFPSMLFERRFVQAYGGDKAEPMAAPAPSGAQLRHAQRLGKRLARWIEAGWPDNGKPQFSTAEILFDSKEHAEHIDRFDTGKSLNFQVGVDGAVSHEVHVAIATGLLAAAPRAQAVPSSAAFLRQQLLARTGQVRLPVRSEIELSAMPASRLLALQPGEVLPLAMPRAIPVLVGDRRFAVASVGEWQGSTALRIETLYESSLA